MNTRFDLIRTKVDSFQDLWEDLRELAYCKTYYVDTEKVDHQIKELKKFLMLKAVLKDVDESRLSPSLLVDEVWQMLASMTQEYAELCDSILPEEEQVRVLHFNPAKNLPINAPLRFARYHDTLLLYRTLIGVPPADIWPPLATTKPADSQSKDAVVNLDDTSTSNPAEPASVGPDLFIIIQDKAQNLQLSFKVNKSLRLHRLFSEYCDKLCFLRGSVTFVSQGRKLNGEEKVSEMIFKDNKFVIQASCK